MQVVEIATYCFVSIMFIIFLVVLLSPYEWFSWLLPNSMGPLDKSSELPTENMLYNAVFDAVTKDPDGWNYKGKVEDCRFQYDGDKDWLAIYPDGKCVGGKSGAAPFCIGIKSSKKSHKRFKALYDALVLEQAIRAVNRIMIEREVC